MFSFADLEIPLVGAPMAGGPSTPQLAASVSNAGGLGMLAAGYLNADQLAEQVQQTRELTDRPFGVNLFCPADPNDNPVNAKALLQDYRLALAPLGKQYGLDLLNYELVLPDHFHSLLDWLLTNPVPVVTFTFGCPSAEDVEQLQTVNTCVGVTITNQQDAAFAAQAGVDFLCVQGPDAGGHQSTFRVADEPNKIHLVELLKSLRYVTHVPLVVAGGVRTATQVAQLLSEGAVAVQLGTPLLLADEAGTKAAHNALVLSESRPTVLTRSFTGRCTRAITNAWTDTLEHAPAIYPALHQITSPVRKAAAGIRDFEWIHAWVGDN